ncbi:TrkA family potassium uptake protein [Olsenella sp. YH-ols2217]|uniref:TrkA family potassium uptake protein n=1 Tax=Kribbibacterium absianum TaxID=3044210 RepID=A0ABT6ZHH6_9ACTN|nr:MULTISPECIES: TrkA family potassium uptake protein [unclassified Olsenella]MDJ1121022.1 TrkA family potassium uptake protein [Olsenella sp. YH-ols2216]MDJ1128513.1 TrkA family potassium uptake protein [Olsenella sp. YH-ols2217]
MKRSVLLIGGYSKTRSLATSLIAKGYAVTAINDNPTICDELSSIDGLEVVCGDSCEAGILDEAGAGSCDISIALSNSDARNLVSSELCKERFGVPKSVSIVNDAKKLEFFHSMGVNAPISVAHMITSLIEQQAFVDDLENVIPMDHGQIEVMELRVPKDSPHAGKRIRELDIPGDVIVACLLRGPRTIVPNGNTTVLPGDRLIVISGQHLESDSSDDSEFLNDMQDVRS